jgi:hypothetical protein
MYNSTFTTSMSGPGKPLPLNIEKLPMAYQESPEVVPSNKVLEEDDRDKPSKPFELWLTSISMKPVTT